MTSVVRVFGKSNEDTVVLVKLAHKHNCSINMIHDMTEISGSEYDLEQFDKERRGDE